MVDKNSDQSIMDKSMRSVFVGNIPYEATEEKLKEIFSEVGPVLSLKLVFDRESGKPKGYGFCEYKDQETALSAMRNLNGYEIGGRTLRVDNACTEKSRMEMQQLLQGPQIENPYGEHCNPENAPEIITKTVASLPPEQMYELMKQMKQCIQNNPSEARQMLLLNPQLGYALLQAQVVMRIIDTQTALNMLYKANQMPQVLTNSDVPDKLTSIIPSQQQHHQQTPQLKQHPPSQMLQPPNSLSSSSVIPPLLGQNFGSNQDIDLRSVDLRHSRNMDQDMRSMPNPVPPPPIHNIMDNSFQRHSRPLPQPVAPPFQTDPRQRPDPRLRPNCPPQQPPSSIQSQPVQMSQSNRLPANGIPNDATDHEKAALIMQVLQLSDEQIAMLPPEQRASILVLKEQIAKSTQQR